MRKISHYIFFALILIAVSCSNKVPDSVKNDRDHASLASKPPMGWNSFDSYDCRINEKEFKATVDFMAENLKMYGWEYAVIDYIWWHPDPGNWDTPRRFGHPNLRYEEDGKPLHPEYTTMDEYGRLLPAVERFPSAADGAGFKPIADYVHSKGLKFGIHIMRGIHRVAWYFDTPVKGTGYSARQIGEPWDQCSWCNHMFGVDPSKPGAQDYYNSLFELYAEWGVDYIKADDMIAPVYHRGELEMIRKAIVNCGRPMVLSLSPGEAPHSEARHLAENATMWRISGDLWDEWPDLAHSFELLEEWSSYIGPGNWPDADMLPLGRISLNNRPHGPERLTKLTWPEQITMMSLWSISKSPLMIGADLLSSPDSTMLLFTNEEVLYVNQNSVENRQVIRQDNREASADDPGSYFAVWTASDPLNGDKFVGLFNLLDEPSEVCYTLEWEMLRGNYLVRDLWAKEDLDTIEKELCVDVAPHGAGLYRLSEYD